MIITGIGPTAFRYKHDRKCSDFRLAVAIVTGGRLIAAPEKPYRLFNVPLTRLEPGAEFEYQVSRNGRVVFAAKGKARASAGQPYRFVVTGDTGANTNQEKRIVHQIHQARPDFFAIAGDIVYSTGRMVEYREKYFPIYNSDVASPEMGAPLIRSRVSFGAYGNHDAGTADLDRDPSLVDVDRLVLPFVVLQAQELPFLDEQDFSAVGVRVSEDELVAPRLLDAPDRSSEPAEGGWAKCLVGHR